MIKEHSTRFPFVLWCSSVTFIALLAFGAYLYHGVIARVSSEAVKEFMDDDEDGD